MELDIKQKMGLAKLFWHWGYFPEIDVPLFHDGATAKAKVELTDIDVFGFKVDPEFQSRRVVGYCTTKKKESAINRAFWLSGIMHHLGVDRGFVVLSVGLEVDHRTAAQRVGVTLLTEEDFDILTGAILPPQFPHQMNLFQPEVWAKYLSEIHSQPKLRSLIDYRRSRFWEDPPQTGLRYALMDLRACRTEFSQKNRILTNVFLDVMAAFAVSLSQMLAQLFQVYLITDKKEELDQRMKVYVYGGRSTYEHLNTLTKQVLQLKQQRIGQLPLEIPQDALALPEWDKFMQVFRTFLEAPAQFFAVPQLLRYVLFERMLSTGDAVKVSDAMPGLTGYSVKFALDLLRYFSAATQMPDHVYCPIRDVLDNILLETPSSVARLVGEIPSSSEIVGLEG